MCFCLDFQNQTRVSIVLIHFLMRSLIIKWTQATQLLRKMMSFKNFALSSLIHSQARSASEYARLMPTNIASICNFLNLHDQSHNCPDVLSRKWRFQSQILLLNHHRLLQMQNDSDHPFHSHSIPTPLEDLPDCQIQIQIQVLLKNQLKWRSKLPLLFILA